MVASGNQGAQGRGLCTFWLGEQHFGLDVAIVSEVVIVPDVTAVPSSPKSVRGLFNLRGTAVPLIDLQAVLVLEGAPGASDAAQKALVLRHEDLVAAFPIDRVDSVVLAGQGTFTESTDREHAAVAGFLELDAAGTAKTVTVLEPSVLLGRLQAVRFVAPAA